jgi:hypothetical protein
VRRAHSGLLSLLRVHACIGALALVACGASTKPTNRTPTGGSTTIGQGSQQPACFAVVNGQETNSYLPGGTLLTQTQQDIQQGGYAVCTGTFVSDNTLVTASHCVDPNQPGATAFVRATELATDQFESVYGAGIHAQSAITSGLIQYGGGSGLDVSQTFQDIAIVIFPDHSAPATTKIAASGPQPGDPVTIVGFGMTDMHSDQSTDPSIKRTGSNIVPRLAATLQLPSDTYLIEGRASTIGAVAKDTMISHGDSGGPLLTANQTVAGVASNISLTADLQSDLRQFFTSDGIAFYASLGSNFFSSLAQQAKARGARIDVATSGESIDINAGGSASQQSSTAGGQVGSTAGCATH